jgi:hypothetical protein
MTEMQEPIASEQPRLFIGMFTGRWRKRACEQCHRPFIQYELSERWKKHVESWPSVAQAEWHSIVKENALPIFCPKCERRSM